MAASPLQGKLVLITGGTGGIGLHTAIGLSKRGAHVVVTGRDRVRGEAGVAAIRQASGNQQVDLVLADLSSQADLRRLVADFAARYDRLDVLINNVGLLESQRRLTVDGIEAHFAVNVLTPFLLTHLLFPILQRSVPARVINVTGGMPRSLDLDNLQAEKSFGGLTTYSHAKAVMMAMSYEFAQRVAQTGVTINVAYPGAADTAMSQSLKPAMVPLPIRVIWPIFRLVMGNAKPERAARSSIFPASSPDVARVNGAYFNTSGTATAWPRDVLDETPPHLGRMRTTDRIDQLFKRCTGVGSCLSTDRANVHKHRCTRSLIYAAR